MIDYTVSSGYFSDCLCEYLDKNNEFCGDEEEAAWRAWCLAIELMRTAPWVFLDSVSHAQWEADGCPGCFSGNVMEYRQWEASVNSKQS